MNKPVSWQTWSGAVRCAPAQLRRPVCEDDVVAAVVAAARNELTVRAAGSGHSFNRLVCTDGMLLDLSRLRGILALDPVARSVTARSGTTLRTLSRALEQAGLALENVGTLADQTVGGAIATGNHGTGLAFGPLASQVTALRLVTADGAVTDVDADSDPELLRCARTSLGALGVVTSVTLRCVPRFTLRTELGAEPLDAMLERLPEWAASAEHVTFGWLPWRENVFTRASWRTGEPPTRGARLRPYLTTLEEIRCGLAGLAGARWPAAVPWLTRVLPPHGNDSSYVDTSHRVFTFPQPVRFVALEHALPLENVAQALRDLRKALRGNGLQSPYSVLVRVGAGDDAPLSPAYGRDTGYVNMTVPRSYKYLELHRTIEQVLREHGARPHWGKAHTATAAVLRPRYPEWDVFQRARGKLDPAGLFTNDYIARVLGEADSASWPGGERG